MQCGVSSVSDSSLFQLILLFKVFGSLLMQPVLATEFLFVAPVTSKVVPSSLLILASSVCRSLQCLNFRPDTRGQRWSFIQAHLFNCAAGREEHCKEISLACVGSAHSVWATLGLLPLTACVLSQSTLLRLQVALWGNCLRRALGCVHFPDLRHSGSGSQVLHKGTDSVGPTFCALPSLEQLRQPGAW